MNEKKKKKLERVPEINKILNGQGLYQKWNKVVDGKLKGIPRHHTNSTG